MSSDPSVQINDTPVACTLAEPEMVQRREDLGREVFSGCQQIEELADGYAFRFPGSTKWSAGLAEFIGFERECCPFFTFELVFEADQGPVWLRLRGPEGTKDFIREMIGEER